MLYDASRAIVGIVVGLGVPALILFALRVYVRTRKSAWGIDDWLLTASIPVAIAFAIACIISAANGVGTRLNHSDAVNFTDAAKWFFIAESLYLFSIWLVKLSFGALLYRLASTKRGFAWTLYVTMAVFSIVTLVTICMLLSSCRPISANWDPVPGAKCFSPEILFRMSFANGIVNIVTDWIYALLPIPLLWNVQMNLRTKVSVCILFSMGVFVSVAAMLRVNFTVAYKSTGAPDYTYHVANLAIWAYNEVAIGIAVGSGSTLRPLFNHFGAVGSSSEGSYPLEERSSRRDTWKAGSSIVESQHSKDPMLRRPNENEAHHAASYGACSREMDL
ncbi:hypothetical protein K490DRAFT_65188 [Saccharata proteae CBS 121410]|uniref:Rhodopsin domain-containing protein n=1 Tax=Saccharata proteae CBS 121410 TaxID=1314787 RepID=A0A9P4HXX2_9PEZI|nr:hypothetical protein K490DRAFT_65188 [Saccharata proteae CBS 121410]